mmetsp:Transcript_37616/g.76540  ORF Transcript_37616/g.76540 Transcript_37616/m.76540 type:complete len:189 (-) Transcript_37616:107-673(-)
MISDQSRLWLLAACLLGCMGTIFTSNSFHLGQSGVPNLNPSPQRYCMKAREAARRCLSTTRRSRVRNRRRRLESNNSRQSGGGGDNVQVSAPAATCAAMLEQVSLCEQSVFKAYRQINMSWCIREIQARTICEVEWCEDVPNTPQSMKSCNDECNDVREALSKCERRIVEKYFHRGGLLADGTLSSRH